MKPIPAGTLPAGITPAMLHRASWRSHHARQSYDCGYRAYAAGIRPQGHSSPHWLAGYYAALYRALQQMPWLAADRVVDHSDPIVKRPYDPRSAPAQPGKKGTSRW